MNCLANSYFINAVESTTGKTPTSLGDSSNQQNDTDNLKKIISEYKNHPSVVKIKGSYKHSGSFDLPKTNRKDINKIIKSLNSKKVASPDKILTKLVKLAANIIDCHICNILFHVQCFLDKPKLLMLDRYNKRQKGRN